MYETIFILVALLGAPMPPAAAPAATPGLYVWVDPETGQLAPPPEDAFLELPEWSLEQAMRTDSVDLVVEQDADGTEIVDLQGRFQSAVFARVAADGTVVIDHRPAILDDAAPAPR